MLTPSQKQARLNKVTSSPVAGLVGANPYQSRLQACLSIKGLDTFEGNKATEAGEEFEPLALSRGVKMLGKGWRCEPAPFRQHPKFEWAGDSADACFFKDDKLYMMGEAKTARINPEAPPELRWGAEGTEEIPEYHRIQCHWHLIHWPEVDYVLVPAFVIEYRNFEFRNYVVKRNVEFEAKLLEAAEYMYKKHIVTGVLPTAEENDTEALIKLHPVATRPMLEPTQEIADLVQEIESAKISAKLYTGIMDAAKNRLRQILGDHEGVQGDGFRVLYRNSATKATLDYPAILAELNPPAELIERHTLSRPGPRSLRIYTEKE